MGNLLAVEEIATGEIRAARMFAGDTKRHAELAERLRAERDAILSARDRNVVQIYDVGFGRRQGLDELEKAFRKLRADERAHDTAALRRHYSSTIKWLLVVGIFLFVLLTVSLGLVIKLLLAARH